MNLPKAFTKRMQSLLGEEFDDFLASYDTEKSYSLRINSMKWNPQKADELPFHLKNIPWTKEGFFADIEERPGKHPLHEAGVYYIQEPSAMSVVSLLAPKPGELICDLCAAPGGKSTQIAAKLSSDGLLVSNEIFPARAKILSQNIERLGFRNVLVCNESPEQISKHFPSFFDRIVVDAPCSGEGMFRKDEVAVAEWSPDNVLLCANRQAMILDYADRMLKPDGVMVYSTCTFAPAEDEDMLLHFLRSHPNYIVEDWKTSEMVTNNPLLKENLNLLDSGRVSFVSESLLPLTEKEIQAINGSLRLWPHKLSCEGHFAVRLRKLSSDITTEQEDFAQTLMIGERKKKKGAKNFSSAQLTKTVQKDYDLLIHSILKSPSSYFGTLSFFGDELYLLPERISSIQGIKLVRAGLHMASRKKNRFEPAHALAKVLSPNEVLQPLELTEADAHTYLHGESLSCPANYKGWVLVCYLGCSLGWGKANNGILKNHYPKGLRR